MDRRCWFRGCTEVGDSRPTLARSHNLPMGLRLCEPHLRLVSRDPSTAADVISAPGTAVDRRPQG
jgi:hypothetical protein